MSTSPPPQPPPGWRAFNGQLVPDSSVAGYAARRQGVRGVCHQKDCHRRISIDFDGLLRRGFGPFPMREWLALLRCHKPGGCALEIHEEREGSGLSLQHLTRFEGVEIRLRCLNCSWEKHLAPAQAIAALKAAKTGDGGVLHVDLKSKLSKPCVRCAEMRWACEVMWPQAAGWVRRPRLNSDGVIR